jgi:hypothetical protein
MASSMNSQQRWSSLRIPCAGMFCSTDAGAFKVSPASPVPGVIFSPYVKLGLPGGNITVGNNSAPGVATAGSYKNTAVISNFEYGFETANHGFKCSIEILDSGGAMYRFILGALNKTVAFMKDDSKTCWFDFGWIIQNKNNSVKLRSVLSLFNAVIHGVPLNIQTTFEGGNVKIKFDIMAPTVIPIVHDTVNGSESNLMDLKTALRKLFLETDPKVGELEFRSLDGSGFSAFEFKNSMGGANGPNGIWKMNQQDKMNTARMWLAPYLTKNNKSFLFTYESLGPIDKDATKIVIQEDPTEKTDCCKRVIAQFVVNGGNDSTVLSFSPNVSWFPDSGGGGSSSTGGSEAEKEKIEANEPKDFKAKRVKQKASQTITNATIPENLWNHAPPGEHGNIMKESALINANLAEKAALGRAAPFEADLKIYGDPFWAYPLDLLGSSVSVLFLNPYIPMQNKGTGGYMEWLAMPKCNATLSNKNYMILGINHQIQNGQFVTTFKLKLNVPNIDTFAGDKLGDSCGSEKYIGQQSSGNPQPASGISVALDSQNTDPNFLKA